LKILNLDNQRQLNCGSINLVHVTHSKYAVVLIS